MTSKQLTASQRLRRAGSSLKTARNRLYAALGNKGLDEHGLRMGVGSAHKAANALFLRIQRLAFLQEKFEREQRELRAALPPTFTAEEPAP